MDLLYKTILGEASESSSKADRQCRFSKVGERHLFVCLAFVRDPHGEAVTSSRAGVQRISGEGLFTWTPVLPWLQPTYGQCTADPEGFPPAHRRTWSLLRNETSFTCSETDTFVCDHNFWMRLLEKRDLWSCLVEPDEQPGLLWISPSAEKIIPVQKKETFVWEPDSFLAVVA